MSFTHYAIETFISDKITAVTECNVSDLYAEFPAAKNWVSGFGLMVIYVDQPPIATRPFALQFVRRAEMAFAEYASARDELVGLIIGKSRQWSPYFRALNHFEATVAQLYQAFDCSRKMLDTELFVKNDGSPLNRLNQIYNTSKHQVAELDQPVWITNEGIETEDSRLAFSEIEDLLRLCARIATKLTSTSSPTEQTESDA